MDRRREAQLAVFLTIVAPSMAYPAQERPSAGSPPLTGPSLIETARALFGASCVRCHGPAKAKGGLRLDELTWDPADEAALTHWQAVLDRLETGEMPPESEPQPEPEAIASACNAIRVAFAGLPDAPAGPRVLRCLTRVQYRNTLRDLLSIDVVLEDPTRTFPSDLTPEGFPLPADGQVMSDFLLGEVLNAARRALDQATVESPPPQPVTHRMFDPRRPQDFVVNHTRPGSGPAYLFLNDKHTGRGPRGQVLVSSKNGASAAGWYEFSITVESKGRATKLPALRCVVRPTSTVYRPEDLHRLDLYLALPESLSPPGIRRRVPVDSIDLPDDEVVTITRRYWLARGWRLEAGFGNAFAGAVQRYLRALGAGALVKQFALPFQQQVARLAEHTHAEVTRANAPRIVIHAASESGPYQASGPSPFGASDAPLDERLSAFAARAFRRPVTEDVLAPYLHMAQEGPQGIRTALEAILSSPRCLYFLEPDGELDDWALAARLSYFLWNTMPDEELRRLAAEGRLRDPGMLRAQAGRLLADPRAMEFVESFTWGWLGLQNALDMAPDPARFPEYYGSRLDQASLTETRTFFHHALSENRPLAELLDSGYTFVNADLARLYGLDGVHTTARFERAALPAELQRGGLLGQAAVLTASANGVDTSPVKRGVWVLEHLLGTPPDPPPPDVPIPEPDARGARSVREVLEQHRSIDSCKGCHEAIDPLGFALEPFDAIGRRRETYASGARIDAAGSMPDGTAISDARDLRAALVRDLPLFTRNLARKLTSYAAGRTLRPSDRTEVDRIAATAAQPGFGLRDLVLAVVESHNFRHR